jgi:hypothetical protein
LALVISRSSQFKDVVRNCSVSLADGLRVLLAQFLYSTLRFSLSALLPPKPYLFCVSRHRSILAD